MTLTEQWSSSELSWPNLDSSELMSSLACLHLVSHHFTACGLHQPGLPQPWNGSSIASTNSIWTATLIVVCAWLLSVLFFVPEVSVGFVACWLPAWLFCLLLFLIREHSARTVRLCDSENGPCFDSWLAQFSKRALQACGVKAAAQWFARKLRGKFWLEVESLFFGWSVALFMMGELEHSDTNSKRRRSKAHQFQL